jgi:hypothetical protein
MDISMDDDTNSIELFFHDGIAQFKLGVATLRKIVDEGVQLLEAEK